MAATLTSGPLSAQPPGTVVTSSVVGVAKPATLLTTTTKPFYCIGVILIDDPTLTDYSLQVSVGGGAYTQILAVPIGAGQTMIFQGDGLAPIFSIPANSTLIVTAAAVGANCTCTIWGYLGA